MNLLPDQIYSEELYRLPQRVIVVLPTPWEELTAEQVTLLGKILGFAKLNFDGVQIRNQQEINPPDFAVFKPSVILSFGAPFTPPLPPYQIKEFNGVHHIYSDSLTALDDPRKKNLMAALTQAFRL